jgi:AhpD family alkylhydroperoxidase
MSQARSLSRLNHAANRLRRKQEKTMHPRIDPATAMPEVLQAMGGLEAYIRRCGLEPRLIALVKIRASQINGCAFCIDMHTRDARAHGETEERLYLLDAWQETPLYSDRERAALAWTEAVTLVAQTHVPDSVYEEARRHFDESELVRLTVLVGAINAWNRLSISFRAVPAGAQNAHETMVAH